MDKKRVGWWQLQPKDRAKIKEEFSSWRETDLQDLMWMKTKRGHGNGMTMMRGSAWEALRG